MDEKKTDESVKAGTQIGSDTPKEDNPEVTPPISEGEIDIDEVMHEHTHEGNIENVEGEDGAEKDVDDLLHKLPDTAAPEAGIESKEVDIDDLMHRK